LQKNTQVNLGGIVHFYDYVLVFLHDDSQVEQQKNVIEKQINENTPCSSVVFVWIMNSILLNTKMHPTMELKINLQMCNSWIV
jgi:hypothetical protein